MQAADVMEGRRRWSVEQADCLGWLASLPPDSLDLVVCSPPYVDCRTYEEGGTDYGIARVAEDWCAWMVEVANLCVRACKGLCAFVVEGRTNDYCYDGAPFLLAADLCRAGLNLRKPAVYLRNGIPGSGGPDWWRNDWEPVLCVTRPGRLPWSDNTACGHAPKWAPGGEMSNRMASGARVNQWGGRPGSAAQRRKGGVRQPPGRPSHEYPEPDAEPGLFGPVEVPAVIVSPDGQRRKTARKTASGAAFSRGDNSNIPVEHAPPAVANPGNVIKCLAGGGHMGGKLAHGNEAPYPEALVEPFVLSFCPPGGVVCDPFSGSGTTAAVAVRNGRRFVGCDLRASQVALARRRVSAETPTLFAEGE